MNSPVLSAVSRLFSVHSLAWSRRGLPGLGLALSLTGLSVPVAAQGNPIFRCTTNTGIVEYSNSRPADSDGKTCDELNLPAITTIQAPRLPAPSKSADPSASKDPGKDFPKVSSARQQQRDDARKKILRDEMRRERAKLETLRDEYKGGEPERLGSERNYQKYLDRVASLKADIDRGENNISALQRELEDLN